MGSTLAVEREWTKALCRGDSAALAAVNSGLSHHVHPNSMNSGPRHRVHPISMTNTQIKFKAVLKSKNAPGINIWRQ